MAAGGLAELGQLKLITSIDERSAAFLALGISTGTSRAVVVLTTSGTAVANLLPAAIEADRSCQPLIFLTADRPERLKDCGSNQTVNQEDFLKSVCRCVEQPNQKGFHLCSDQVIKKLAFKLWQYANDFRGPVHLNVAFEEPLHPSFLEQKAIWNCDEVGNSIEIKKIPELKSLVTNLYKEEVIPRLDPSSPGVVIVGPWRGPSTELKAFNKALNEWQKLSRWPVFADPLSGVNASQSGLIHHWELILSIGSLIPGNELNILRLGPHPSSRFLDEWLLSLRGKQVLITESDKRYLDPLKLSQQWSYGLQVWWNLFYNSFERVPEKKNDQSQDLLDKLVEIDCSVNYWLDEQIKLKGQITEPAIARWVPKLVPLTFQFMLSASSPIRDWLAFSGSASISRRCFAFRGASGIDGTLSLAMGLSYGIGPLVLVTGDLALLHDSNGWLFAKPLKTPLIILLIDNDGGGIFSQLEIEKCFKGNFSDLFKMPQSVDPFKIASAHDVLFRQISSLEDLEPALEWGVSLRKPVLLRVCTYPDKDNNLRVQLRDGLKEYLGTIIKNKK